MESVRGPLASLKKGNDLDNLNHRLRSIKFRLSAKENEKNSLEVEFNNTRSKLQEVYDKLIDIETDIDKMIVERKEINDKIDEIEERGSGFKNHKTKSKHKRKSIKNKSTRRKKYRKR